MNDNTNQVLKVKVARVAIGNVAIEGLLDLGSPELKPRFLVGFPQICSQFNIPPNNASRDFKALLGEGFKIFICRYENTKGNNFKALNLLRSYPGTIKRRLKPYWMGVFRSYSSL